MKQMFISSYRRLHLLIYNPGSHSALYMCTHLLFPSENNGSRYVLQYSIHVWIKKSN